MRGIKLVKAITQKLAIQYDNPFFIFRCQKDAPIYHIYDSRLLSLKRPDDNRTTVKSGIAIKFFGKNVQIGLESSGSKSLHRNFSSNTDEQTFEKIIKNLCQLSNKNDPVFLTWNGKQNDPKKEGTTSTIWEVYSLKEYREQKTQLLGTRFLINDMGVNLPNSGKGRKDPTRGHDFCAEVLTDVKNKDKIEKIAIMLAPYLNNFFPMINSYKRNDNLRRKMLAAGSKIQHICAYKKCIKNKALDAAHIRPVNDGGSDSISNGIFLCKKHHHLQEKKPLDWHKSNLKAAELNRLKLG